MVDGWSNFRRHVSKWGALGWFQVGAVNAEGYGIVERILHLLPNLVLGCRPSQGLGTGWTDGVVSFVFVWWSSEGAVEFWWTTGDLHFGRKFRYLFFLTFSIITGLKPLTGALR